MGDVIDWTLMHINDLPKPIPLPIHQRGLSLLKHDYLLEIREVAKTLPSNLWKVLSLIKLLNLQRKKILYDARKGRLHSKSAKALRVILGRSFI